MSDKTVFEALVDDPLNFLEVNYDEVYTLSNEEHEKIQLSGLQKRFNQMKDSVLVLNRLAKEQGIESIENINDAVHLLFPHTMYKSYPLSVLENGRMDRLTKWLDGLTSYDLSGFDAEGLDSIDEWIQRLDQTTDLKVLHTFGTSGKLSFMPRTAKQWEAMTTLSAHCVKDWKGKNSGPDLLKDRLPMVQPGYRHGAGATYRGVNEMVNRWAGGDDNALFLFYDYFSADIASLAGRLKVAESKGEQGQLKLSSGLLARRDEFAKREQQRPQRVKEFLKEAIDKFGGRDIFLFAVWPILFEWAEEGLKDGVRNVFGKGSVLMSGGGSKGKPLPEDYREQIFEFIGSDNVFEFYGMSELMQNCPKCEHGNYHIPPTLVPFVLDPQTGEPLPRKGSQTGRFAFVDLLPDSYWGGLITGDEVTVSGWDEPCSCGRSGPYLHPQIMRYSEKKGGDDKINCAGAPEAHDKAVDFLISSAG